MMKIWCKGNGIREKNKIIADLFLLHHGVIKSFSHAFDYHSLSVSSPYEFNKLLGLRSSLIHMYGLLPHENWHSLSILW